MIITCINRKQITKWQFTPMSDIKGEHKKFNWVAKNFQDSKQYPGCYDFEINIYAPSGNVFYRHTHSVKQIRTVFSEMNNLIDDLLDELWYALKN